MTCTRGPYFIKKKRFLLQTCLFIVNLHPINHEKAIRMKEFVISEAKTETAVLVGLITKEQDEAKTKEYLDELEYTGIHALISEEKPFSYKLQEPPATASASPEFVYLDYGYVLSVHKAQGSGWNKVMVYDEGFGRDDDTRRRWLYTAITRAKKELLIVKKDE